MFSKLLCPTAVFSYPVVFLYKAYVPTAVFSYPVRLKLKDPIPIAVFPITGPDFAPCPIVRLLTVISVLKIGLIKFAFRFNAVC